MYDVLGRRAVPAEVAREVVGRIQVGKHQDAKSLAIAAGRGRGLGAPAAVPGSKIRQASRHRPARAQPFTSTLPVIIGWIEQKYGCSPGVLNTTEYRSPVSSGLERKLPSVATTV